MALLLRRFHPALSSSGRGTSLSPTRACEERCKLPNRGLGGARGPHINYWMALLLRRFHPALSSSGRGTSLSPTRACEERCKLPNRGLGRSPRSFHTLRFKSLSRLPCEYMYMYPHQKNGPCLNKRIFFVLVKASMYPF